MIRLGLVDDQLLVRKGIGALLAPVESVQVVLEAGDAEEAIAALQREAVDVLLLDMRMPKGGGLEVLRRMRDLGRLPPTIVLTTFDDEAELLEAVVLGARGYLLKDVGFEQLIEVIRTVAGGGMFIQPIPPRAKGSVAMPAKPALECLTAKEKQVLRLMSAGFNNHEIARALDLAHGTVKNHVSSILSKLDVCDRTRAVLRAMEQGLI